eukprot:TRINITY_DN7261_c0_g1_i1.p2 TRINITY_DN7261_c0_g1~~TRINITY_DN7261_c0_g1_i1.p2  ORF type:complete len:141 (-),score=27.13 TRINITY_DN7261_c0_g1_i1:38-460(-)
MRRGGGTRTATKRATTTTATQIEPEPRVVVLQLGGAAAAQETQPPAQPAEPQARRHIEWQAETIDNEHMNKKKSKKCCIFHKPRSFGESDTESSDDNAGSSGNSTDSDGGPQRPKRKRKQQGPHQHAPGCSHAHDSGAHT